MTNALSRSLFILLFCFLLEAQITSVIEGTVADSQGLPIAEAAVAVRGHAQEIDVLTDENGHYRITGLLSEAYDIRVSKPGFTTRLYERLPVTLNRVVVFDVELTVNPVQAEIRVSAEAPLLEPGVSSSGATIVSQQIHDMPINGRNYLDLMQLVPGVMVSRQSDIGTDGATLVLGERGGNAIYLIDGMPNSNLVDGGPAASFDQNSIFEFQVITAGYKAEFGYGSGGVVNVISRSGGGQWHGQVSGFHRNSAFDSPDVPGKDTPFLLRWDLSTNLGGPIVKDRVFLFSSVERIRETRELNFSYPPNIPAFLRAREQTFDQRSRTFETRTLVKLDETLGPHRLTQRVNVANDHITGFQPLSLATSLPSTRSDLDSHHLIAGLRDTATIGDQSNPFLLNAYLQYRGESYSKRAASPQASPATTLFNLFSGPNTGGLAGDLGQVVFGAGFTRLAVEPDYFGAGAQLNKLIGAHDVKFGLDFQRTRADGVEASNLVNQLFATTSDFAEFGPVNSGLYILDRVAGPTANDNRLRLRNNYNGLFVQDDWKLAKNLTLNAGLRWDHDSRFPNRANFSPRLGLAWSPTSKTVLTASWGLFYDHYRLGLARDVPRLGGANLFRNQTISLPRLFFGIPTTAPQLVLGLCPSPTLTDAQIRASGATCSTPGSTLLGVDHLNSVVAPGHVPVPSNAVVSVDNVQALSGLTPAQFADAASAAVGRQPGFLFWGGFGNLTANFPVPQLFNIPIVVDSAFRTPYTRAAHAGAQREVADSMVIYADYHHRDIRNMLGVRATNLAFEARLPGRSGQLQPGTGTRPVQSYGSWYQGTYDGISVGIRKRVAASSAEKPSTHGPMPPIMPYARVS